MNRGNLLRGTVALGLALAPIHAGADDGVSSATNLAARPATAARLRSIMSLLQAPEGQVVPPPAQLEAEVAPRPPSVTQQLAHEAAARERAAAREQAAATAQAALPPEPPTGRGMMIAGGPMIGVATILSLFVGLMLANPGALCWAEDSEERMRCVDEARNNKGRYIALLPPGLIFAGGTALLAVGGVRQSRWWRWKQNQTVAPNASRTVLGTWTAGVALRF